VDKTEALSAPEAAGATVEHHHRWFWATKAPGYRLRLGLKRPWCVYKTSVPCVDVKHVVMLRLLKMNG
jgi:hypothetical protein